MKKILIAVTVACLSAMTARPQSEVQALPLPRIRFPQITLLQVSAKKSPGLVLPENPIPVQPSLQDGPAPCPGENGKSCALLGGRAYFSDPFHMTEHDASWKRAIRNPAMLVAIGLNLAATVADAEATHACLHAHTCRETNPLLGSHPNRAREYGTVIPIDLVGYVAFAMLKKQGRGNIAFGVLWASTMAHVYFASAGWSFARLASPTPTSTAKGQNIAVGIRF